MQNKNGPKSKTFLRVKFYESSELHLTFSGGKLAPRRILGRQLRVQVYISEP